MHTPFKHHSNIVPQKHPVKHVIEKKCLNGTNTFFPRSVNPAGLVPNKD